MSDCEACGGRGWTVTPDGGAGLAQICACCDPSRSRPALVDRMLRLGMGPVEIDAAFVEWEEERDGHEFPKPMFAAEWLRWALAGGWCPDSCLRHNGRPPQSSTLLVLMGATGRGKSMVAAKLLARYLKGGGVSARWCRVPATIRDVMGERRREGFSITDQGIIEARFVVLDDVGYRVDWDVAGVHAETVANWIDERGRYRRPTVITTNAEDLSAFNNPRLESRLSAGVYRVVGGDVDFRVLGADNE
jgi:hypothetical protein